MTKCYDCYDWLLIFSQYGSHDIHRPRSRFSRRKRKSCCDPQTPSCPPSASSPVQNIVSPASQQSRKTLDLSIPPPGRTNLASRVPPDIFAVPKPHISLNHRLHGYVELATYPSIRFSTFLLRLSILRYGSLERSLPLGCPERLWWCFLYGCMSLPGFMKHAPLHTRILILCLV